MLTLVLTKKFKQDFKRLKKSGKNLKLLEEVVDLLLEEKTLPEKYKDHALSGNYKGFRECHIQPDWLLIYYIENYTLCLTLARTGTHCLLFK